MTDKNRRWIQFLGVLGAIYLVLFVFFRFASEATMFVTDSWRISSKEDPFLYPLVQVLTLVLVLLGIWLGLWLAYRMLLSDYRRYWFGGFFALLGGAGIAIWASVSDANERSETWHIPVIGGGLIALGLAFVLFFKAKSDR